MRIEIRADSVHLSGYANVAERKSRPVVTPRGRVVEEIEQRAFQAALDRAANIPMTKDHDPGAIVAETRAGSLKLHEDSIGLHYDAEITDPDTVEEARAGKIKGLSFGMYNVRDELEERAGDIPLRRIKALDLDHLTLVVHKTPVYSATSVEVRASGEVDIEGRATESTPEVTEIEKAKPKFDNSAYKRRVEALKKQ